MSVIGTLKVFLTQMITTMTRELAIPGVFVKNRHTKNYS